MKVPRRIDLEAEMDRFIPLFGGKLVRDVLGTSSPTFSNADYWFENENIMVELKCLSEDKSDDARIQARINKLFDESISAGRMPDPGGGTFVFESNRCPPEVEKGIYKIFARPIRGRLRKANQQIKETRLRLGRPDAYGLVLLANDGNYRLEPDQLVCAVETALGQNFSGIDTIVVFTANMLTTAPCFERHVCFWVPASRSGHRSISKDFLDRFQEGWARHLSRIIGEDIPSIREVEHAKLHELRYDQQVSKARW